MSLDNSNLVGKINLSGAQRAFCNIMTAPQARCARSKTNIAGGLSSAKTT